MTRFWYSTTSSWAISRTALRTRDLALAKSAPPRRCSVGASPPDVLAQAVDLVARHVELVAALVGEQQVVALDAADGALDHPLVVPDAVLVVDDVVARLEVLEEAGSLALARPGLTVGSAPTGEVALGDDGQLRLGQRAAAVQRGDDDVAAGPGEVGASASAMREVEAAVAQQLGQAVRRAPSPSAATTTR